MIPALQIRMSSLSLGSFGWAALMDDRERRSSSMKVTLTDGADVLSPEMISAAALLLRPVKYSSAGLCAASCLRVSVPRPAVPVQRLSLVRCVLETWLVKGYERTTGDENHFPRQIGDVFGWVEGSLWHCANQAGVRSRGITQ